MITLKLKRSNDTFSVPAKYGIFIVFLILVGFFLLSNSRFFTAENLFLILQQASPLGTSVVGMIFVLIVVGIDISVGRSMFLISTIVGYLITTSCYACYRKYFAGYWS